MTSLQLREMTFQALEQEILQTSRELFKIRMQCYAGVQTKTHLLKLTRRTIARMKTILKEKVGYVDQN